MSRPPSALPAPPDSQRISLVRLLAVFLKIGTIGFGGGMAVIALMDREFVQKRKLLTAEEFLHGVGLGQILGAFAPPAAAPSAGTVEHRLGDRLQRQNLIHGAEFDGLVWHSKYHRCGFILSDGGGTSLFHLEHPADRSPSCPAPYPRPRA